MDIPRTFTQRACLQEQQKMEPYLGLTFYEAVVRQAVWKLLAHVVAYVTEVERLEVALAHGMEEYENGHHLAVGHEARAVAAAFAAGVKRVFFQFRSKIFAELIENTENFY